MRKLIIKILEWLIWAMEGKAVPYYIHQWDVFCNFTLPNLFNSIQSKSRRYSFNIIDGAVRHDPQEVLTKAIEQENNQRRFRNQKKAHLSVERWAREKRHERLPDIQGEESLHPEAKLSRTEMANANNLYKQLSFGRVR